MAKAARMRPPPLDIRLASIDGKPVSTHTGMSLQADCAIHEIEQSSITYLPAIWRNPDPSIKANRDVLPWLHRQHQLGGTLAGVGTGCCFLAEAGLLHHRPATTHWYYFDRFKQKYPEVQLKRDFFITHADRLYCTASVNSLADLTVLFIRNIYGETIAKQVERHFFHEVRQAYLLAHQGDQQPSVHADELIIEIQTWLQENATATTNIEQLAGQWGLSVRSLNRRFKQAVGIPPLRYLQNARLRMAGELLQSSNISLTEVADKVGYQDMSHFTSIFKRYFGTTPSQYRSTVRAKLFNLNSPSNAPLSSTALPRGRV